MTTRANERLAAAIDIGSNSIKMTVARLHGDRTIEQLAWASEVVRLGEGVAATGRLDERRMDAAIETLQRFAAQARELGATTIVAVATEATRAAANGTAFLARARDEAGVDVRLIDGDEEAALTFRGLAGEADLSGSALIADIGGGSTELIVAIDGTMTSAQSVALGSGRLTERLVKTDPPTAKALAACEAEASRLVKKALQGSALIAESPARLLLVGGTPEYMVQLMPDGQPVDEPAVRSVLTELTAVTAAEVSARIAVPEARAKVLPAGVAIVAAIARHAKPSAIEVAHSGVRAGLLLELFHTPTGGGGLPARSKSSTRRRARSAQAAKRGADAAHDTPDAEADFRETMKALIAERWDAVWDAIPVALAGEDIEGVHDVRVASRRLRAAMDVAAPVFPKRWYKALHRAAKDITGALGEVRDRDVLLEAWRADRVDAPLVEHPGIDRLIARVERERVAARIDMEAFLEAFLAGPTRGEVERRFGSASREKHPAASAGKDSA